MHKWIEAAKSTGGKVTMICDGNFKAKMEWPCGDVVTGSPQGTEMAALAALDEALAEDAAEEMRESGLV